jgi:predicted esterase
MKKKLTLVLVYILASLYTISQTLTPKGGVQLASGVGGYYEFLPAGYDGVKKFPLILFLHGIGNQGNGSASSIESLVVPGNGLMAMLKTGAVPDQGMIVIAPQYGGWPTAEQSLQVLDTILKIYPVDLSRVYITGLSMGGGATWELAALAGKRIAAIAPICGASDATPARINSLVAAGMPISAFHSKGDPVVSVAKTNAYVDGVNAAGIKPVATKFIYNDNSHASWNDAYLPYQGIYDFFRKYSRGAPDTSKPTPPATIRISASEKAPAGWLSDAGYVANVIQGYWGGTGVIWGESKTISGTSEQALYNKERWGQFEYRVPVQSGSYTVVLHFVELLHTTTGRRLFNVDIEGKRVLNSFDMLTIAPRFTAITRTFGTSVTDGTLNMQFSGSAKITAVEIIPGELRTLRVITEIQDSANYKIISRDTTYQR